MLKFCAAKRRFAAVDTASRLTSLSVCLQDDEIGDDFMPRLFQCSNATGAFCVNEIVDFVQVR